MWPFLLFVLPVSLTATTLINKGVNSARDWLYGKQDYGTVNNIFGGSSNSLSQIADTSVVYNSGGLLSNKPAAMATSKPSVLGVAQLALYFGFAFIGYKVFHELKRA